MSPGPETYPGKPERVQEYKHGCHRVPEKPGRWGEKAGYLQEEGEIRKLEH